MALVEKTIWSIPPDLPGVEVVSVENCQQLWSVYHQTYTICNIDSVAGATRGSHCIGSEWIYRSGTYSSCPQSLMLMEPGEIHSNTKIFAPGNLAVVLIAPALVDDVAREAGLGLNPHLKDASTTDIASYQSFAHFHALLARETDLLHRQSALVACISRLLTAHGEKQAAPMRHPGKTSLTRARDLLHSCFEEAITLEQLASLSGLSRFHFLRAFRQEFGLPPHAYQVKLRIQKARLLLQLGIPVSGIEVGFSDQSHFIRHFKRVMRVTPGQYTAMVNARRHNRKTLPHY